MGYIKKPPTRYTYCDYICITRLIHLNFILNIDMFPDLLALPLSLLKSQDDQDADAWMETVDLKVWRIKAFHIFYWAIVDGRYPATTS